MLNLLQTLGQREREGESIVRTVHGTPFSSSDEEASICIVYTEVPTTELTHSVPHILHTRSVSQLYVHEQSIH